MLVFCGRCADFESHRTEVMRSFRSNISSSAPEKEGRQHDNNDDED